MSFANVLTLFRLALAPLLALAILAGDARALWIFGASVATDLLDGFAARTFSRKTRLGALLDPLADKATLVVAFTAGAVVGLFPVWFVALLALRDLVQLATAGALLARHRAALDLARFEPAPLGKYAATAQFFCVLGRLAAGPSPSPLDRWLPAWMLATALLTVAAGVQYLGRMVRAAGATA